MNTPRLDKGQRLFARWLASRGITYAAAGRALGASRVTVFGWANMPGRRPGPTMRPKVETWTHGDVPETAWLTKEERAAAEAEVVPFVTSAA